MAAMRNGIRAAVCLYAKEDMDLDYAMGGLPWCVEHLITDCDFVDQEMTEHLADSISLHDAENDFYPTEQEKELFQNM